MKKFILAAYAVFMALGCVTTPAGRAAARAPAVYRNSEEHTHTDTRDASGNLQSQQDQTTHSSNQLGGDPPPFCNQFIPRVDQQRVVREADGRWSVPSGDFYCDEEKRIVRIRGGGSFTPSNGWVWPQGTGGVWIPQSRAAGPGASPVAGFGSTPGSLQLASVEDRGNGVYVGDDVEVTVKQGKPIRLVAISHQVIPAPDRPVARDRSRIPRDRNPWSGPPTPGVASPKPEDQPDPVLLAVCSKPHGDELKESCDEFYEKFPYLKNGGAPPPRQPPSTYQAPGPYTPPPSVLDDNSWSVPTGPDLFR